MSSIDFDTTPEQFEARIRAVSKVTPDIYWVVDSDGNYTPYKDFLSMEKDVGSASLTFSRSNLHYGTGRIPISSGFEALRQFTKHMSRVYFNEGIIILLKLEKLSGIGNSKPKGRPKKEVNGEE